MNEIMFTIPHRLTRLNEYIRAERGNRYAAASIKSEMTDLCTYYMPNIKIDYPIEITYIWTVKNMGNDLGNVSFGNKFIEDAMVQKRLIKSDNLTVIKKITHKFRKGEHEKVTVIVKRWRDESLHQDRE